MVTRRYINFGVSQDEYQAIKAAAEKNGMSAGQYCRMRAITESNISAIEENQRAILDYQKTKLLDRDTMKGVLEYLNKTMPKLVYDYFQQARQQRT